MIRMTLTKPASMRTAAFFQLPLLKQDHSQLLNANSIRHLLRINIHGGKLQSSSHALGTVKSKFLAYVYTLTGLTRSFADRVWMIRLYFLTFCLGLVGFGYLLIAISGPDHGTSGAILTGYVAGHALISYGTWLALMGSAVQMAYWLRYFLVMLP
jgi:hypothetical protein